MKGSSEGTVRAALANIDLDGLIVYKPPDDARNWKPCDFMVWWQGGTVWIEVKQTPAVGTLSVSMIRPAQRAAIHAALEAHLPYWLIVYWTRHGDYTVSRLREVPTKGLTRVALSSKLGTQCNARDLGPILRMAFLGEMD